MRGYELDFDNLKERILVDAGQFLINTDGFEQELIRVEKAIEISYGLKNIVFNKVKSGMIQFMTTNNKELILNNLYHKLIDEFDFSVSKSMLNLINDLNSHSNECINGEYYIPTETAASEIKTRVILDVFDSADVLMKMLASLSILNEFESKFKRKITLI